MHSSSRSKPAITPRGLAKLFDSVGEAVWIVDSRSRLVWLNQACELWLGVATDKLVGRQASAATTSDDHLEQLAAALSPPTGTDVVELICAECQPPNAAARMVRYQRVGVGKAALIFASTGRAIELRPDGEIADSNRLRSKIHQWRKRDAAWGGMVAAGSSRSAKRLRGQIQLAIASHQEMSIVGPVGCGGEAIARRIHAARQAAMPPAMQVTGALVAIDGPLMDSELLDASLSPAEAHLGGEQAAEESRFCTLLLRGLDDTPLDVQQQIEQFVGERSASVRLMALLNRSIDDALSEGKLLATLAARLEVLTIRVDALSTRATDIPLIASALVDARHTAGSGPAERLNRAALDRFVLYPWPGNFDELDAAVRQAMANCPGPAIGPEHLPLAIRSYQPGEPERSKLPLEQDLDRALERYELRLIKSALDAAGGNRSEAARMLGISRARLLRRLDDPEVGAL